MRSWPTSSGQGANLLIVHRYLWPENLSTYPLMLKDIVEHHRARGDKVTILTALATDTEAQAERGAWAEQLDVDLIEIRLSVDRGRSALHRIVASLRFSSRAAWTILRGNYNGVSVSSYPFIIGPVAVIGSAAVRRIPALFHVQDIVSARMRRRTGAVAALGRVAGRIERILTSRATVTITLTEDMKATLREPDAIVMQNFLTGSVPQVSHEGTPSDQPPEIIYAGNVGHAQNLLHAIAGAAEARTREVFTLRIIGDGSAAAEVRDYVHEHDLGFVRIDGLVGRLEADRRIRSADIGMVASESHLFEGAFPSKTLSYLRDGLGVLILCEDEVVSARELVQAGVARLGSPRDPAALSDIIVALVQDHRAGRLDRTRTAAWAHERFGKQHYFERYEAVVLPQWIGSDSTTDP